MEVGQKAFEKKTNDLKFELAKLIDYKNQKVAEERVAKKVAKKTRQRQERNKAINNSEEISADEKADDAIKTDYNIPVDNMFNQLQNKDTSEFLDEENNQNDFSAEQNFNQTPDISSNLPSDLSKPVENICDLSATDFKKLLDEIISNFNQRAAGKT